VSLIDQSIICHAKNGLKITKKQKIENDVFYGKKNADKSFF
jgi:hypothetical protein